LQILFPYHSAALPTGTMGEGGNGKILCGNSEGVTSEQEQEKLDKHKAYATMQLR